MKLYKDPLTNELYGYDADGSQDSFIRAGLVAISNSEADQIRAQRTKNAFNSLTYAEKRAMAYPSFADQFDLLYHGGYDAWKAAIAEVKNKYPKP